MTTRWRLITDPPTKSALNMGIDRALLVNTDRPDATPTLRLYSWNQETLSVGYAQSLITINMAYLEEKNIPIVRRPTGGRALLHNDEVTYAVIIPATSGHYGSLSTIYQLASLAIIDAFRSLGVATDKSVGQSGRLNHTPCCFSTMTRHEIAINGKKVVGSAQRRIFCGALQHGSIVLTQPVNRYLSCFEWDDENKRAAVAKSIGGVNDGENISVSAEDFCAALIRSFGRLNDIEFYRDSLTDDELALANSYADESAESVGSKNSAVV